MTTETAEMFLRRAQAAEAEAARLQKLLLAEAAAHRESREALTAIADGRWNVGVARDLDVREFARRALNG